MHLHEIIAAFKERRAILGVTQEQLAELSGVGLRTIKALESGSSNPTFETLFQLAEVLGMELKMVVKKPKL